MKKKLCAAFVLLIIMLVGCTSEESSSGLVQVSSETVDKLVNGEENGFFLAVSSLEENFVPYLEDVLAEKKVKVNYYHTYQPEGKDGETAERQVFDVSNKMDKNRLYYIENGKISEPLRLTSFAGLELTSQIQNFIEVHKE